MVAKRSIVILFSVLLVVMLVTSTASARPLADALGTAFTYQGRLVDGGLPANGTYDFQFSLYNALSSGTPVGSTITMPGVTVTNGLFTVQLDFGNVYDGTALYLQVAVSPAGAGTYTPLTPLQPLSATPYALYSKQAGNAALLGGQPAGNASGNVPLNNGTLNTNLNADLLDGLHGSAFQQHYQNVRVVAKSGGDYTTINAALGPISDASASNPYLIYVAPGVYNETFTMKSWVDIQGSGELTTKITWTGSTTNLTGTVMGASNAELRFLIVENTGGKIWATAICNTGGASPRLTHVTANASGGISGTLGVYNWGGTPTMVNVTVTASGSGTSSNYGIENVNSSSTMANVAATSAGGSFSTGINNYTSSSVTMTNVTASASGATTNYGVHNVGSSPVMTGVTANATTGTNAYGVYNESLSSPTMTNVTANATLATSNNYGVYNTSSSPVMTGVTASGSGGTTNYGMENISSSSPVMMGVTASASGGTSSYGMWNDSSSPTIQNSVITGSGGSSANDGLHDLASSGAWLIQITNSKISGGNSTIYNNSSYYTVQLGASQLSGGGVQGSGTYLCVFSYNASYGALNSTCH